MSSSRDRSAGAGGVTFWALAALPLVLLAGLLWAIVALDPTAAVRGNAPPVEVLSFERVTLAPDGIRVNLLNDGPDPVTVAQIQVDEAYWSFSIDPANGTIRHLERATVEIPYPWVEAEAHNLRVVTSTGVTFDHTVAVALETPRPSVRALGVFALIGIYVGVLPVALGLLWYPVVRRLGERGMTFVLALTIGLLLFLLLDAVSEGWELARELPGSYHGAILFVFAGLAAFIGIEAFGQRLARGGLQSSGWIAALLVAIGIGLHNFGEGLAIGAAVALGEAALGTLLIVGFTLHNTTEGLAIVAPLAHERAAIRRLVLLGAIAGLPTIAGAWLGGFVYSPTWSVVFLGLGAGAIGQVIVQISSNMFAKRPLLQELRSGAFAGGLLLGVLLMYATGLLIG